jgi:hypothetical protein
MAKRRPLFNAIAFGCAMLAASPSWAAVIQPGIRDLTINQGQGFKPVTSAANANVGDSVMVGPGGSAPDCLRGWLQGRCASGRGDNDCAAVAVRVRIKRSELYELPDRLRRAAAL